jgi:hypothetical protein
MSGDSNQTKIIIEIKFCIWSRHELLPVTGFSIDFRGLLFNAVLSNSPGEQ